MEAVTRSCQAGGKTWGITAMVRKVLLLAAITAMSAGISGGIGLYRNKEKNWPRFSAWWDSEGLPIFLMVWFVLGAVLIARGWLGADGDMGELYPP